ncbi:1,6-anhydro-N-acetylmuramyl-L-alanine amidase AmpD [bacterium BMS3Bbin12]|nr:1,6-anhydro-N-acetylmuramyl-L-alanine amidase AmpD [bacterium BMS3Abin12]GBE47439.1 1,6-anhydro-N-acetylmuramyl-L-alanine amidase AmpD [bacterium BMS3Bbin12]GBE51119.1 1,6-anhydro-N-acetylmuramyl-L-alanine amidase AmpD [bacterium BMS3Bbin13]HDJ86513.1 1,6-anhydro-N-acetylmuramyl-L-alanine amidase AmpD [Chromatiales bacterium]HDK03188.1 1,6-anhydro-N-acetylmuramyl-L-alanine amidase AmpD [Gammaproteobacteria bacterium]
MRVDPDSGWIDDARRVPSPNCDARPPGTAIDLVVVHGISLPPGEFGGPWIDALFRNRLPADAHPYFRAIAGAAVSAHLLIRRDGEPVQYVPFHLRAWHAGESRYGGRTRCNDFSVGVELEGADHTRYEAAQYHRLAQVIGALMEAYPGIQPERIVGHGDIAPGRKSDPWPIFDWARLRGLLAGRP